MLLAIKQPDTIISQVEVYYYILISMKELSDGSFARYS